MDRNTNQRRFKEIQQFESDSYSLLIYTLKTNNKFQKASLLMSIYMFDFAEILVFTAVYIYVLYIFVDPYTTGIGFQSFLLVDSDISTTEASLLRSSAGTAAATIAVLHSSLDRCPPVALVGRPRLVIIHPSHRTVVRNRKSPTITLMWTNDSTGWTCIQSNRRQWLM